MEPTIHSVYMFFPPNAAQLVLHADNHVEIRFERTRTLEILKWFEDRVNEFRMQVDYHVNGPRSISDIRLPTSDSRQETTQDPRFQTSESEVGGRLPEVASAVGGRQSEVAPGATLPLGTLLSRDQVEQLMRRYPKMKLEGEGLYKACVELGFIKTTPDLRPQTPEQTSDFRLQNSESGVGSRESEVVYASLAEPLDEQGKMLMRPNESLSDFVERANAVYAARVRTTPINNRPILASHAGTLDGMAGGTIMTSDGRLATADNQPPTSDSPPQISESEVGSRESSLADS